MVGIVSKGALYAYIDNAMMLELAGHSSAKVKLNEGYAPKPEEIGELLMGVIKAIHKYKPDLDILGFRFLPQTAENGFIKGYQAHPMMYIGTYKNGHVLSSVMSTIKINPWDYVFDFEGTCAYGQERLSNVCTLPSVEMIKQRMNMLAASSERRVGRQSGPGFYDNAGKGHSIAEE